MTVELERRLFTLEEYERMVEAGVFHEDERIELIRGQIAEMAPIGFRHEMCVARLNKLLSTLAGDMVLVWPQNNSIRLPANSRPEPDLTLLKWRDDYSVSKPPVAEDVLLVVEVAESSLKYDREVKGPLYAEANIPEYWIVNLRDEVIEVHTGNVDGAYKQARRANRGETLMVPGLADAVEVGDILGQPDV